MIAITVSLSLPETSGVDEQTARELLVLALVESGRLSQSQGAETLGIGRYDLIDLMGQYRIPVVRLSPLEQAQELAELDRLRALRATENPREPSRKRSRSRVGSQTQPLQ